jgi:uncharacterized glyoxalase superfamily protein PhnB
MGLRLSRDHARDRVDPVNVVMTTSIETAAVTPYVMTQDLEPLIAIARQSFGAEEVHCSAGSAAGIHCQLRIGSVVFVGGAVPGGPVKPRLLGLHVYVADVDAVHGCAIDAGGVSLGEPADRPYGERAGSRRPQEIKRSGRQ